MTGRYRHLTRPVRPANGTGFSGPQPYWDEPAAFDDYDAGRAPIADPDALIFGSIYRRTILFIFIALVVGAGLLSIVPDLSASGAAAGQPDGDPAPEDAAGEPAAAGPEIGAEQAAPAQSPEPASESASETAPAAVQAISPIFTPEVQHWAARIADWSAKHGLDPDIVATIMQIESCGDPGAASHAGAQGLFQVMPFHFAPGEDMLDPDTNAMRGLAFYNRQLEYTAQNIYLSFAGYNGGYAASGSSYPYWANETQRYYTWASGIYDEAKAGLSHSPTLQQWLAAGGSSLCRQAAGRLGL